MGKMVIAVDPGREKCGIAVVEREKGALMQEVIATTQLEVVVKKLLEEYQTSIIVMGDGTSSQEAKGKLEEIIIGERSYQVILVDERHSTDQARKLYWKVNPPKGLMRLIPVTMQVPPGPVDDYVAVILAERYFNKVEL